MSQRCSKHARFLRYFFLVKSSELSLQSRAHFVNVYNLAMNLWQHSKPSNRTSTEPAHHRLLRAIFRQQNCNPFVLPWLDIPLSPSSCHLQYSLVMRLRTINLDNKQILYTDVFKDQILYRKHIIYIYIPYGYLIPASNYCSWYLDLLGRDSHGQESKAAKDVEAPDHANGTEGFHHTHQTQENNTCQLRRSQIFRAVDPWVGSNRIIIP